MAAGLREWPTGCVLPCLRGCQCTRAPQLFSRGAPNNPRCCDASSRGPFALSLSLSLSLALSIPALPLHALPQTRKQDTRLTRRRRHSVIKSVAIPRRPPPRLLRRRSQASNPQSPRISPSELRRTNSLVSAGDRPFPPRHASTSYPSLWTLRCGSLSPAISPSTPSNRWPPPMAQLPDSPTFPARTATTPGSRKSAWHTPDMRFAARPASPSHHSASASVNDHCDHV